MEKHINNLKQERFKPEESLGRRKNKSSDQDDFYLLYRTPFAVDVNKIRLSKACRRLSDKTQVFYSPNTPYARDRRVHTDEVVSLAEVLSDLLGLNVSLTKAIAWGHDMGHVPFGHKGEDFLSKFVEDEFRHNVFALIVAEWIERDGRGLNLSFEVLEGIYCHSGGWKDFKHDKFPQEYLVAKIADKVAYTLADYNDAIRMGYTNGDEDLFNKLGNNQRDRTKTIVKAILEESADKGRVSFSESDIAKIFSEARSYMFNNVYKEADKRINNEVLRKAYECIRNSKRLKDHDPVLVFALLSEDEVRIFSQIREGVVSPKMIDHIGITEILSNFKRLKIENFSSFPFNREDFELIKRRDRDARGSKS